MTYGSADPAFICPKLGFVHSVDRTRAAGYPRLTPHSQERVSHGNPAEGDYTGPAPVRGGVQRTGLGLGHRAAGGGHLGARAADRGRGAAGDGPERRAPVPELPPGAESGLLA